MVDELNIETKALRLRELFEYEDAERFGFDIPSIQRDFQWLPGAENDASVDDDSWRLVQDLLDFHHRDPEREDTYFLGTIILFKQKSEERLQVMDGQQRLTALVSMFSIIRYLLDRAGDTMVETYDGVQSAWNWSEDIRCDYLTFRDQPVLTPKSAADLRTLNELRALRGDMDLRDDESLTSGQGSRNKRVQASGTPLYLTSLLYLQELASAFNLTELEDADNQESLRELVEFALTVGNRVVVNRTVTGDISLAYRMFITANTRGLPLTNFDIFRGLLVARGHERQFAEDLMEELDEILEVISNDFKERENKEIDTIMTASAAVRNGRRIAEKNVSKEFEHEIRQIYDWPAMKELAEFTEDFVHTWFNPRIVGQAYIIHRRFQRLTIKQHFPLCVLMKVKGWESHEMHTFLSVIECFVMRVRLAAKMDIRLPLYNLMPFAARIYAGEGIDDIIDDFATQFATQSEANEEGFERLDTRRFEKDSEAFVLLHAAFELEGDPGPKVNQGPKARRLSPRPSMGMLGWLHTQTETFYWGTDTDKIGNWFVLNGTGNELNALARLTPEDKIPAFRERGLIETRDALDGVVTWSLEDTDDRIDKIKEICEDKFPPDCRPF